MRLKRLMSLVLKAKCSVTALMAKKQCSAVQSNTLHWGQVHENAKEIAITALTALSSAVTLHFVSKIKHLLSYARAGAHAPTT
jgi:hypothetical protein